MSAKKSCAVCGIVSDSPRCPAHTYIPPMKAASHLRGYDHNWRKLSKLARQLQPYCSRCHATTDLTCDHLVWPAVTLSDVDVLCRRCNSVKGAIRGMIPQAREGKATLPPPKEGDINRIGIL